MWRLWRVCGSTSDPVNSWLGASVCAHATAVHLDLWQGETGEETVNRVGVQTWDQLFMQCMHACDVV